MKTDLRMRYLARAWFAGGPVQFTDQEVLAQLNELLGVRSPLKLSPIARFDPQFGMAQGVAISAPGWQLFSTLQSVDLEHTISALNEQAGELSDYANVACSVMKMAMNLAARPAHRLAIVSEDAVTSLSAEECDAIAAKLIAIPDKAHRPLEEWNWRILTREEREIAGKAEVTNTIAHLHRARGSIGPNPFDGLRGLVRKAHKSSDGKPTRDAFLPDERTAAARVADGKPPGVETSINLDDCEDSLRCLRRKGLAKFGAAKFPIEFVEQAGKISSVSQTPFCEPDELDDNPYHGNIVYPEGLSKIEKRAIAQFLAAASERLLPHGG